MVNVNGGGRVGVYFFCREGKADDAAQADKSLQKSDKKSDGQHT